MIAPATLPELARMGGHLRAHLHVQAVTAWGDPLVTAAATLEVSLSAAGWGATVAGDGGVGAPWVCPGVTVVLTMVRRRFAAVGGVR